MAFLYLLVQTDRILKVIDELLKYGYSDAVFTEVTLPLGEVKADSNEKYVRYM